jgi:hypothetical protein
MRSGRRLLAVEGNHFVVVRQSVRSRGYGFIVFTAVQGLMFGCTFRDWDVLQENAIVLSAVRAVELEAETVTELSRQVHHDLQ